MVAFFVSWVVSNFFQIFSSLDLANCTYIFTQRVDFGVGIWEIQNNTQLVCLSFTSFDKKINVTQEFKLNYK